MHSPLTGEGVHGFSLGEQPLYFPRISHRRAGIGDAVMQPKLVPTPKLYVQGGYAVPPPIGRARDRLIPKPLFHLIYKGFERFAAFQGARLLRGPSPDLARARARCKIGIRFRAAHGRNHPFDMYLTIKGFPEKAEAGFVVVLKLVTFAAFLICIETKPSES